MSSPWSLVVPVLLIGLAAGIALALFWRRRERSAAGDADRRLLRRDLEERQRELYRQIRVANDEERANLEIAAARNLQALDDLGGGTAGAAIESHPPPDASASPGDSGSAVEERPMRRGSPLWTFLGGFGTAALIGVLVIWAGRDAAPREEGMSPPVSEAPHPQDPDLDPRQAEAIEQLGLRVDADPTDWMARKQYAVALLSAGQFFAAFEQAEILLQSNPDDLDGLYVAGMVRMRMGQEAQASELLERVVEGFPGHVAALTALGVLAIREQGFAAAEAYWQQALDASGGSNPEVEQLIAAAREQFGAAAAGGEENRAPAAAAPPPAAGGPSYTVTLELADGVDPRGVLFVSLRQGDSGPPAAVERIERPRFPLTLTLDAGDSMLGRPLPEDGLLRARLDRDGSASTREEGAPAAEVSMRAGEAVRLTLQ